MYDSYFDIGTKITSLICTKNEDFAGHVIKILKDMNNKIYHAQSVQDALEKIKFNQYDLIIIDEGFDGNINEDKVLTFVRNMAPVHRRKVFVILFGNNWKTADEMTAFAMSVNLLINKSNLEELKGVITQAMIQNQKNYKIFNDIIAGLGKA